MGVLLFGGSIELMKEFLQSFKVRFEIRKANIDSNINFN